MGHSLPELAPPAIPQITARLQEVRRIQRSARFIEVGVPQCVISNRMKQPVVGHAVAAQQLGGPRTVEHRVRHPAVLFGNEVSETIGIHALRRIVQVTERDLACAGRIVQPLGFAPLGQELRHPTHVSDAPATRLGPGGKLSTSRRLHDRMKTHGAIADRVRGRHPDSVRRATRGDVTGRADRDGSGDG